MAEQVLVQFRADKALKEGLGMIVDNYHKFKTNPSDLMLENLLPHQMKF